MYLYFIIAQIVFLNVVLTAEYVVEIQRIARRVDDGSGREEDTQLKVPSAPTRYACELFVILKLPVVEAYIVSCIGVINVKYFVSITAPTSVIHVLYAQ